MRCSPTAMLAVVILSGAVRADEADAVKVVEKLGGKIIRDDKQPGKPIVGVGFDSTSITDADLKVLKHFQQLLSLNITNCRITDAGLKELKELKQLTSLELAYTSVTDVGLKELQ